MQLVRLLSLLLVTGSSLFSLDGPKPFGQVTALGMKVGDVLKIDYRSSGCFHRHQHELVIHRSENGAKLTGAALLRYRDPKTFTFGEETRMALQTIYIDDKALARLERSFRFLRSPPNGASTTIDDILITHLRGGKAIAYEVLEDSAGQLADDKERLSFWDLAQMVTPKVKK